MQIIILNGGIGKRVKTISKDKPKCLIEIANKPFIYHQLKLLEKKGIKKFLFCLGYRSNQIKVYLKKNFKKINKQISVEKKKMGTGGAILNAKKLLDDIFFVTYGDSYLDINYKKIFKKFLKSDAQALLTVVKSNLVKLHKPNILIRKKKIINKKNNYKYNYVDYGLILLKKTAIKDIKLKNCSLDKIILDLIKKDQIIFTDVKKKFYEIGSINGIKEMDLKFKNA